MARTPVRTRPVSAASAALNSAPAPAQAEPARRVRPRKPARRVSWSRLMRMGYGVAAVGLMSLVLIFVVGLLLYSGDARNALEKSRKPDPKAALQALATPTPDRSGVVARALEPEELQALVASGEALVVDARPTDDYLKEHIPGVQSLPHYHITGQAANLPRDKMIVTICNRPLCPNDTEVSRLLIDRGVDKVGYLKGGFESWLEKGLPTEK